MWAMFCHLGALAGYIIPFGNILLPLVFWLMKKDQYPFTDNQGKEALNFQITVTIAAIVAWLSIFICIGVVLLPAVGIANIVFIIIAAIKSNAGEAYKY
ncbi:MAG: DUF4870 domain-containing protein, partial [Phycisphaerae bacterium]|nr:DUF4870 domain-containing protein [Phycisphaerae bacterium]